MRNAVTYLAFTITLPVLPLQVVYLWSGILRCRME